MTVVIQTKRKENFDVPQGNGTDKVLYKSSLGTPVYTNLEIEGATYTRDGVTYQYPKIIIDTVLMTVTQTKNIVKTSIQGRNGTIKEYISDGDYMVNIKAMFVADNGKYPKDEIRTLKTMLNNPNPITINSWYLQNLDIDSIVVNSYNIAQEAGKYSVQSVDINCESDVPVILKIAQ